MKERELERSNHLWPWKSNYRVNFFSRFYILISGEDDKDIMNTFYGKSSGLFIPALSCYKTS